MRSATCGAWWRREGEDMTFLHPCCGLLIGYEPEVMRDVAVVVGWGVVAGAFVILAWVMTMRGRG